MKKLTPIITLFGLILFGCEQDSSDNNNGNDTEKIEGFIDQMELSLDSLTSFILPGGDSWSSYAQISRSICRRAERSITELNSIQKIDPNLLKFINRLSDYLFVLARYINKINGVNEVKWNP